MTEPNQPDPEQTQRLTPCQTEVCECVLFRGHAGFHVDTLGRYRDE